MTSVCPLTQDAWDAFRAPLSAAVAFVRAERDAEQLAEQLSEAQDAERDFHAKHGDWEWCPALEDRIAQLTLELDRLLEHIAELDAEHSRALSRLSAETLRTYYVLEDALLDHIDRGEEP